MLSALRHAHRATSLHAHGFLYRCDACLHVHAPSLRTCEHTRAHTATWVRTCAAYTCGSHARLLPDFHVRSLVRLRCRSGFASLVSGCLRMRSGPSEPRSLGASTWAGAREEDTEPDLYGRALGTQRRQRPGGLAAPMRFDATAASPRRAASAASHRSAEQGKRVVRFVAWVRLEDPIAISVGRSTARLITGGGLRRFAVGHGGELRDTARAPFASG